MWSEEREGFLGDEEEEEEIGEEEVWLVRDAAVPEGK